MKNVTTIACFLMSLAASGQAINSFREIVSPIDEMMLANGNYLFVYDLHFAPLKPHSDLMGLKGGVKKMTQTITVTKDNLYDYVYSNGEYIDTVYFTQAGNVSQIKYYVNAESILSFGGSSVVVTYDDNNRINDMREYSLTNIYDKMVNRMDVTQYTYSADGKLQSEIYNMYNQEDDKWVMVESFKDQLEMGYYYDAQGRLSMAKKFLLNGDFHYNSHGMLSKIVDGGITTGEFNYDDNDRLSHYYTFMVDDGLEESTNYRCDVQLTRNDKGDIVRAVKTQSECNDIWRIVKKGLPKTFVVSYVYDNKGNWTKATLKRGNITVATIKRSFVY